MRSLFKAGGDASKSLRHLTVNSIIDVQGDRAQAVSYVVVLGIAEAATNIFFSGLYSDQLVRNAGRWLIERRTLRPDFAEITLPPGLRA
jgi:hypothetical protein